MPPRLKKDFLKLVQKYLNGNASPEELNAIENYYSHFSNDPDITDNLNEEKISELKINLRQKIDAKIIRAERRVVPLYKRRSIQVAASILLFLTIGLFFINKSKKEPEKFQAENYDLTPGGNKATLTLADGSKIDLADKKNGTLKAQPGSQVIKQNEQLTYRTTTGRTVTAITYNTLTTPRGGQYKVTLADGTKVWLNAASSLKYPTAFTGAERVVELSGEAYFEVVHNSKQPFKVKTAGQIVQDIGTQFNVNSYPDEEAAATTLVEGSVKIYNGGRQTLIAPGQQYVQKNGISEVKNDIDIDEVTAWKNGMFQFNNADIKTIMRQISRWYNVDVEYSGQVPGYTYHGRISRNSNASAVLKILELSGIDFTIERGKIIVK